MSLSLRSFLYSPAVLSAFTLGLLRSRFARVPNLRVDSVSGTLYDDTDAVTIRAVLALPPRESWRSRVSLESRYGMWDCWEEPPEERERVRALITFPRAERLKTEEEGEEEEEEEEEKGERATGGGETMRAEQNGQTREKQ